MPFEGGDWVAMVAKSVIVGVILLLVGIALIVTIVGAVLGVVLLIAGITVIVLGLWTTPQASPPAIYMVPSTTHTPPPPVVVNIHQTGPSPPTPPPAQVMFRCRYCQSVYPETLGRCPRCGAGF